jgi:hypothetical protein
MARIGALVAQLGLGLAVTALTAATLVAQAAEPENEDSRFSFFRANDGFLRLDGVSGQTSLCTRHPAGWLCQAAPEERTALEAEIGRLQAENAALKKEVLLHGLPLPSGVQLEPTAATGAPGSGSAGRGPTGITSMIASAWRRFVALVTSVQRDILERS